MFDFNEHLIIRNCLCSCIDTLETLNVAKASIGSGDIYSLFEKIDSCVDARISSKNLEIKSVTDLLLIEKCIRAVCNTTSAVHLADDKKYLELQSLGRRILDIIKTDYHQEYYGLIYS